LVFLNGEGPTGPTRVAAHQDAQRIAFVGFSVQLADRVRVFKGTERHQVAASYDLA
jgi:hypothetical protein